MMFSFYEALVSELVKTHYMLYQDALPGPEEQKISLADLRSMTPVSADDIERFFIFKEADSVLRENSRKQLQYFKEKLNVPFTISSNLKDAFWEASQRRNLIVHNDGVVDNMYLSSVPKAFCAAHGIEKDVRLNVTPQYILQVYDCLFELGCILVQACWRRWLKKDTEKADTAFNESIFSLLEKKRYAAVKNLARFAATIKPAPNFELPITVNKAIADQETNDHPGFEKSLRKIAGFPESLDKGIVFCLLKGEYDEAYLLLCKARETGNISRFSLQWPIFRKIKSEPRFIALFEDYP